MEVGTEISQKIRSAIKAKLIELGAYVDDELPDYIMVMVANKKNREQMVSDLSLFLGGNTDAFAEWLHGLLGKLQTISVDSKDVKEKKKAESKKEKKTKKNSTSQGKNKSVSGPGASSKKNKSLALEDAKVIENKKNSETVSKSEDKEDNSEGQSNDVEDVRQLLVTGTPTDELAAELETTEATIEQSKIVQQKKTSVSSPSKGTTHSKVTVTSQHKRSASPSIERKVQSTRVPAKKFKGLTSVVASVSKGAEEDEEYDPLCPAVGNVASVVKVTSRKSKVPPALQANRALLVKAMGEAERSIAIKRKAVLPRLTDGEDSPSDVYTPKRRRSGTSEASPPPYIPSRKQSSSTSSISKSRMSTSHSVRDERRHQDQSNRRTGDARQSLPSRDHRDLISRSRRIELLQRIGIDRKEEPVSGGTHRSQTLRTVDDKYSERTTAEPTRVTSREVSSSKKLDGVRDLKIMARLGPVRGSDMKSSDVRGKGIDLRNTLTRSSYSKGEMLQVVINPTAFPALKDAVGARLGKSITKCESSPGDDVDKERVTVERKRSGERTRMAVSRLAKSLVNKQCQEAVMSVREREKDRGWQRNVSPDSRRVEANDSSDEDVEEEEEESELAERNDVVIKSENVSCVSSQRADEITVKLGGSDKVERVSESSSDKESDDLAHMIGETLEPELLNDTVQGELNLDLEEKDDVDDIETMIGVKSEEDKPKLGTRFIVTLDGVDERQFDAAEAEKNKNITPSTPFIQPAVQVPVPTLSVLPPSGPLMAMPPPSVIPPIQPSVVQPPPPIAVTPGYSIGIGDTLPPNPIAMFPREPAKQLPPKIQPFSISLKDSDDETEDKDARLNSAYNRVLTSNETLATNLQKAKMSERCKFWPACAAGAECEFHHPTSYCKTFPNCKFGDKCIFIHPNCKFDSKCTRQDCPFTHISRRPGLSSQVTTIPIVTPKPAVPPPHVTTTVCRFFPNCHNPTCLFIHPKPCRFGIACQNTSCMFYHPPSLPAKNKLKWQAQAQKDMTTAFKLTPPLDPTTKFRQPVAKVSPMSASGSITGPPNIR